MKALLAAAMVAVVAACGPRQVEVRSAPESSTVAESTISMTNNLNETVNVYVRSGGTDTFVGTVGPKTSAQLPVRGVAAGSVVTLKATAQSGEPTYTRDNVTLSGMFAWTVP